ncbi:hypothetical protein JW948_15960 [bacterium]|nr:hypothetical protein [bacterium]
MKTFMIIAWCLVCIPAFFGQDNAVPLFEPGKITEDIDFLLQSLDDTHPEFHRLLSDSNFAAKIDSIKNSIVRPLSTYDFFKIMQPVICVDGHTALRFDGTIGPEIEAPFFPFRVIILENQIYITENLSSDGRIQKGTVIETINGKGAPEIMHQLSGYIPHESLSRLYQRMSEEFHLYYRLVYGNFREFSLVLNQNGVIDSVCVPGTITDRFRSEGRPMFDFKMLGNDVAYLYIEKFRRPDFFMATIDSVFGVLKDNKTEYLIIDKRSGGGFTSLVDSLLSYLTDQPYEQMRKEVKISAANRDYIDENKSRGIIKDGVLIMDYPPIKPVKRNNFFKGKTYVLMNRETYSAAVYFVSAVKCNHLAPLVGEEASQPLISNGDLTRFQLPNTQINCYSSMSTYHFPCAENRIDSVKPDFEVKLTIGDVLNDHDRCLEYALKRIDQDR